MVIGASMTAASSIRIKLSDPGRASDLRAYFRRHDALVIDNEDGTLDVHLLKPFSDRDDEPAERVLQALERARVDEEETISDLLRTHSPHDLHSIQVSLGSRTMGRGSRPVRRWRHDRKKKKAAREKRKLAAVARPSRPR
jgi:hypothetical protein